jgi:tetratricopeptide (TPR) repeat protein
MYLWAGVLAIAFGGPFVAVWWRRRKKRQVFIQARLAEMANPHDATARLQLGQLYLKHRKWAKAQIHLEDGLAVQREKESVDPRMLDALAQVYTHQKRYHDALALLEESLELDATGNQGEVPGWIGVVYQKMGDAANAQTWLERACAANTSRAEPVFRLACHLRNNGKPDEARQVIARFLPEAHLLPRFIRQQNRWWVHKMRFFPLTAWMS